MAELRNTLMLAREEIVGLRRRNEILQAKVDTMDLFALVFKSSPNYQSLGAGEDVVWALNHQIEEATREAVAPAVTDSQSRRARRAG